MPSTSITSEGGVTVVTQVFPRGGAGGAIAPKQAPPPDPPTKMDDMTAAFLRGSPHALGVVQIFIGLLCVLFSLTSLFSPVLILHALLCLAVTFVVSGSLAVAAARRTSLGLVWACLAWNLLGVALGVVGVAYLSWLLADRSSSQSLCGPDAFPGSRPSDRQTGDCVQLLRMLDMSVSGLLGVLLVLLVLQVGVVSTVSIFSCRALGRCDAVGPVTVEAGDGGGALLSGAAARLGSDVSLLDAEGQEDSQVPGKL